MAAFPLNPPYVLRLAEGGEITHVIIINRDDLQEAEVIPVPSYEAALDELRVQAATEWGDRVGNASGLETTSLEQLQEIFRRTYEDDTWEIAILPLSVPRFSFSSGEQSNAES